MRHFSGSPGEMCLSLWRNRELIGALIKREVVGRYRGSVLGIFWSFFNPVFMLAVYTFVFSVIFKTRWSGGGESKSEFALILFAGMIVFNFFSECVNRAPGLILWNVNYVKKVVFPLEILPIVSAGAALFHTLVSVGVWGLFYCVEIGVPYPTVFLFPLVLMPLLLMVVGIGWVLASLGVFLRDVGQLVGIMTSVLMFLSPIFFPASALPEIYRPLLSFNPLAPAIDQMRAVLYWGKVPDWIFFFEYTAFCLLVAWLGFVWFQKTRKGFADVL